VGESVADGVGDGGLADELVPRLHGHLAGDQRRTALGAVLGDLEQVVALGAGKGGEAPVVDLCGAPYKSTYGEHSVMWSEVSPAQEPSAFTRT